MKKLLVGLVLPILAATAIIGSGFSFWAFADAPNTPFGENDQFDVVIQGVQGNDNFDFGTITGLKFSIDQKTKRVTTDNSQKNGAHFTYATDAQNKEITKATIKPKQGVTNFVAPKTITTRISIPTAVASFVQLTDAGATEEPLADGSGSYYDYVWDLPDNFSTTASAEWDISTLVTPEYRQGKEPNTYELYKAMKTQMEGAPKGIGILYILGY